MAGFDGNIDEIAHGTIRGWVLDPCDPEGRLVVTARLGGTTIALARAEHHRADVAAAGKGSGRHGFALVLSRLALALLRHRLRHTDHEQPVRLVVQRERDGRLGPGEVWCSLARRHAAALHACGRGTRRPQPPRAIGAIQRVDASAIRGWCVRAATADGPSSVILDLLVDDVWTDTTLAHRPPRWRRGRPGQREGAVEPLERLVFRFPTPRWLNDGRDHTVRVLVRDGDSTPIDRPVHARLDPRTTGASAFALPPLVAPADAPIVSDGPRAGEYEAWIEGAEPRGEPPEPPGGWPTVSVLIATRSGRSSERAALAETGASLDRQGIAVERVVFGPGAPRGTRSLKSAVSRASGAMLLLCTAGDLLADGAVKAVLAAAAGDRDAAIVFGDDDIVDAMGVRRRPRFKTAFCPDRALTDDLFGGLTAVRGDAAQAACAGSPAPVSGHTLALKVARARGAAAVRHLPRVLAHRSLRAERADRWTPGFLAALLTGEAQTEGAPAPAIVTEPALRVVWPHPEPGPAVSVIIPTKDRPHLFEPLVRAVLSQASALDNPVEVVIVDNDSREADTFAAFGRVRADPRVRTVHFPDPFNFAAANNRAVAESGGDVLVFMNNDIASPAEGMLDELVRQAVRPDVGVVGARLAYADGTNQHCGIGLGIGGVGSHLLKRHGDIGRADHGRFRHVQTVSAVTAALMAMRRDVFEAVGGFDETLPLAYNDVDLCLKVTAQTGRRVIYTPFAAAYHLESQSRGLDTTPDKRARLACEKAIMTARWGERLRRDPYLSPHHALDSRDLRPAISGARAAAPLYREAAE